MCSTGRTAGSPGCKLPPVMFDTFPNAHDGYGSFVDLESATVADAAGFFERYYAAGNAVLSVAGDLDPDAAARLVERHFGDVPARSGARAPRLRRAGPDAPSAAESYTDRLAPLPAVAAAWRVPNPITDFAGLPAVRRAGRGAH